MNTPWLLLGLLISGIVHANESPRAPATVTIEAHAFRPPTATYHAQAQSATVWVEKGCEYVSHDMEVLERTPGTPAAVRADGVTLYKDKLERDPSGRIYGVTVTAQVHVPSGSAMAGSIHVRLSVNVLCDEATARTLDARGNK